MISYECPSPKVAPQLQIPTCESRIIAALNDSLGAVVRPNSKRRRPQWMRCWGRRRALLIGPPLRIGPTHGGLG